MVAKGLITFTGVSWVLAALLVLAAGTASAQAAGLKKGFYKKSCPRAEDIAREVVWARVAGNRELAAKFLRMFFHDCFVRGCDASVLLDSPTNTAEKDAAPNLSLAGFDVIDEVKAALERACPGVVSCADIVALAARDSVSFQYKRNLWEVETGRRDGTVSSDQEALDDIPAPSSTFDILLANFSSKGLGLQDLVVLSGGHTIGIGHCNLFSSRLFNFTGKNNPSDIDPALNPPYARFLQGQCRRNLQNPNDNTTVVPMDPGSSLLRQPLLRQPQGAPGHVHLRRHAAHRRPRRQHRRQAAGPGRLLRRIQELHQAHGADRRAHRRQRPDQEEMQRRQLMIIYQSQLYILF